MTDTMACACHNQPPHDSHPKLTDHDIDEMFRTRTAGRCEHYNQTGQRCIVRAGHQTETPPKPHKYATPSEPDPDVALRPGWEKMLMDNYVETQDELKAAVERTNPTQPMRIRYMTLPAHTDPIRKPFLLIIDRVPRDIHEMIQDKADELAEQSGAEAVMVFTYEIKIGTPDL